jgi:hypothetical protein
MNIKSLLARLKTSCSASTKEEKDKKLNQVIEANKTDFPED